MNNHKSYLSSSTVLLSIIGFFLFILWAINTESTAWAPILFLVVIIGGFCAAIKTLTAIGKCIEFISNH